MKKQTGLTLIELIIVVVIIGIMAAIAVPNFGSLLRSSQLKTAYNDFVGVITTARSEAINKSSTVTLCVSTDGDACVSGSANAWSDGYMIFVDRNRNGLRDTGAADDEEILSYQPAVASGLTITSIEYPTSISIAARGRLQQQGSFVFCDNNNELTARALNLWVTGLGRLATDDDGDGIVEAADRNNISCNQ